MVERPNTIWRDFATDGVPSSGLHKPRKSEIRAWGEYIQAFLNGGNFLGYTTKAALDADLDHAASSLAIVYGDSAANDGLYVKSGASGAGSWSRIGDVPGYGFVVAADAGGTANAIAATTSLTADSSKLIALPIETTNTSSPVTVAFNGGTALTIKSNAGTDIATGGLVSGMVVVGYVSGTTFRLISTHELAAAIADATNAATAAAASAVAAAAAEALAATKAGTYTTVSLLAAAALSVGAVAFVTTEPQVGFWELKTGDFSAEVAADTSNIWYKADDAIASTTAAWRRRLFDYVVPVYLQNSNDATLIQSALDSGARNIRLIGTAGAIGTQIDVENDNTFIHVPKNCTLTSSVNVTWNVTADNFSLVGGGTIVGPGSGATYNINHYILKAVGTSTSARLDHITIGVELRGSGHIGAYLKFVDRAYFTPDYKATDIAYAGTRCDSCDHGLFDGCYTDVLDSVGTGANAYGLTLTHDSTNYSSSNSRIYNARPSAAGSGYAVGDTITASGGTGTAATFTVTGVSAGAVVAVKVTSGGDYSVLPSSPISTTTSGGGTSLTLAIETELNPANPFCYGWTVRNATFVGPRIWQAVDTHGAYSVSVEGCRVYGAKHGISLTSGSGGAANYAGFANRGVNNTISILGPTGLGVGTVAGYAFTLDGGSSVYNKRCVVAGNIIDGYGVTGSSSGGVFRFTNYASNILFVGNIIKRWRGCVWAIGNNCTGISIIGNQIDGMELSTETVGYIISLTGSGYNKIVVAGNVHTVTDGTAANWVVNGSGTIPTTIKGYMGTNDFDLATNYINSSFYGAFHGPGWAAIITVTDGATTLDVAGGRSATGIPITFKLPSSGITANVTITDITGEAIGQKVLLQNDNASYNFIFTRANAVLDGGANITLTHRQNVQIYRGPQYWQSLTKVMANS